MGPAGAHDPPRGFVWGPGRGPQGDSIRGAGTWKRQRLNPSLNVKQANTAAPSAFLGGERDPGPGAARPRGPQRKASPRCRLLSGSRAAFRHPGRTAIPQSRDSLAGGRVMGRGQGGQVEGGRPAQGLNWAATITRQSASDCKPGNPGKGHGTPDPSLGGWQRAHPRVTQRGFCFSEDGAGSELLKYFDPVLPKPRIPSIKGRHGEKPFLAQD